MVYSALDLVSHCELGHGTYFAGFTRLIPSTKETDNGVQGLPRHPDERASARPPGGDHDLDHSLSGQSREWEQEWTREGCHWPWARPIGEIPVTGMADWRRWLSFWMHLQASKESQRAFHYVEIASPEMAAGMSKFAKGLRL